MRLQTSAIKDFELGEKVVFSHECKLSNWYVPGIMTVIETTHAFGAQCIRTDKTDNVPSIKTGGWYHKTHFKRVKI